MAKYSIDHGIPVPGRMGRRANADIPAYSDYPLDWMDVSDSFFIPTDCDAITKTRMQQEISRNISNWKKKTGNDRKIFTVRSVSGGIRAWRLK